MSTANALDPRKPAASEGMRERPRSAESILKGKVLAELSTARRILRLSHRQESILRYLVSSSSSVNRPEHVPAVSDVSGYLAWPLVRTIATEASSTERTIWLVLARLKELGLIETVYASKGGRDRSSVYRVSIDMLLNPEKISGFGRNPEIADIKPCNDRHGTLKSLTRNPEKTGSAYKEDNIIENIREQHQQQQPYDCGSGVGAARALEVVGISPEVVDADADAGDFPLLKSTDHFWRLEQVCGGHHIDGSGRKRIRSAATKFGFTLAQLEWVFTRKISGLCRPGGLIGVAESWAEKTSDIADWPQCYVCLGTGVELLPRIKTENGRGAIALAGVRAASLAKMGGPRLTAERFASLWGGSKDQCFGATDEEVQESTGLGASFCACDAGKAKALARQGDLDREAKAAVIREQELSERLQRHEAARVEPEERKIEQSSIDLQKCPECEGAGHRQQCDAEHICAACCGSGQHFQDHEWREQGKCPDCCGSGKVRDFKQPYYVGTSKKPPAMVECSKCEGSGNSTIARGGT